MDSPLSFRAGLVAAPVLAIDIGGTKIAGGLVTPDGEVHFPTVVPTPAIQGGEAVLTRVIELVLSLARTAAPHPNLRPVAIGVSTGGQVVPGEGSIGFATAAIPEWGGMQLGARLARAASLPVQVENDGNAMALGEALFGAGRGSSLVVGITVGTGIGGGIVMDGRVFHGAHGISNALGHIVLKQGGRKCPCGRRGCLEAYASATAISADFIALVGRARLGAEFGLVPGSFGVKEISKLAAAGQPEALVVLKQGAIHLGTGIGALINILDPAIVVVGGGAAQSGDLYFPYLQAAAAAQVLPGPIHVPVVPAQLGAWANLVGAACVAWGNEYPQIYSEKK
jgi:glucokinase